MGKKLLKCAIIVVVSIFVVYNSIYFKKLDEVKASANKEFNATAYARNYLDKKLIPSIGTIPSTDSLLSILKQNAPNAFKTYSHAMDIGNIGYFMSKGQGVVTSIDESDVSILTPDKQNIKIATEYIFGNALRDAPGIININDFTNTGDLNSISSELDKIVRNEVVPPFKAKVKKGDKIEFAGAFELNKEHLNLDNIEVIPFYLKIQ